MSISFDMGEDLQDIVDAVHNLAEDQIRPHLREFEQAGRITDELARLCHELGLTTLVLPESLGGMDMLDTRAAAVCCEELAWGDVGAALDIPGPRSAGFVVTHLGTEEQQQRLLTPFADEEAGWQRRGTLAFVEGPFGLDPAAIETTARREGDQYVLDGTKRYVQSPGEAELTIVLVRDTSSAAANPWDRLALFAVEGRPAGLSGSEPDKLLGLETARYGTLTLDGVKVSPANRLDTSAPGALLRALKQTVARKRILDSARLVGLARAASEYAFKYATERQTFGVYLYEHQALAFMMADMAIHVDGMRTLVWEAASVMDRGDDASHQAELAMKQAKDGSVEVASDAVQVLGGHGYIQDHPVEKWMRDARTLGLVDGLFFDEQTQFVSV